MSIQKSNVIKVTAEKGQKEIITDIQTATFEESNESYSQICNPFFQYIFEEIEKIRKDKNDSRTAEEIKTDKKSQKIKLKGKNEYVYCKSNKNEL